MGWAVLKYRNETLSRQQRAWLVAAALIVGVGTPIQALISRPEWNKYPAESWWPTLVNNKNVYDVAAVVLPILWSGLAVWMGLLLVQRIRTDNFFDRKTIRPLVVGTIVFSVLTVVVSTIIPFAPPEFSWHDTYALLGLLMEVLLISLLASLAARLVLQSTLLNELPNFVTPNAVEQYFRNAMGDRELKILFWDRTAHCYVNGRGAWEPLDDSQGAYVDVVHNKVGEKVAAIVANPAALRDWRRLDEVRLVAYGAVENARLQAILGARVDELDRSRRERRSSIRALQRDLHDVVQQTLYAARLDVYRLQGMEDGAREGEYQGVIQKVDRAIAQIRTLSNGAAPLERSADVEASIHRLADELGLRAFVFVDATHFSELEYSITMVCAELLTNVHKHAKANEVIVRVGQDGDVVRLQVLDDGVGGVNLSGSNLRTIQERMSNAGGRVFVESAEGMGTKVIAEWPLQ